MNDRNLTRNPIYTYNIDRMSSKRLGAIAEAVAVARGLRKPQEIPTLADLCLEHLAAHVLSEAALEAMAAKWCAKLELLDVYVDRFFPMDLPYDSLTQTLGARCASLRVFKMECCGSICMNDQFVAAPVRTAPLEELWLKGCWRLTDESLYAITRHLSTTLKKFGFGDIPNISSFAFADVAKLTLLEEMDLDDCPYHPANQLKDFDLVVPRILKGCPRLRRLGLIGRIMSDETIQLLVKKERRRSCVYGRRESKTKETPTCTIPMCRIAFFICGLL